MDRIIGLMSLYNPISTYCQNISIVAEMVDLLILIDDSEKCQKQVVDSVITEGIMYVWNGENIGLSKSINKGIDIAFKEDADWILIMDQDSVPENDIVSVFKKYIINYNTSDTALLAPQYDYDRHIRKPHSGSRVISHSNLSGALLNSKVINQIGKFDERFFVDGLDFEWCLRARKMGFKIIECSEAMLSHKPAESRFITVLGKKIIGYGISPDYRHYYQIKAGLLIMSEYRSGFNVRMLIIKVAKSLFFYGDIKRYLRINRLAYADFKANYFGKYRYE